MLFYAIDPAEHAWQRKLIASNFSAASLRKTEQTIHQYVDLFVQKMGDLTASSGGAGVDTADAVPWLAFDIMG